MIGKELAQVMKDRLEICKVCPALSSDSKLGLKCSRCGCFIRLKIAVKTQYCPIGKW